MFCSQTVSLSPAISSQFIPVVCAAAEDRKKLMKKPLSRKLSQSSMLIRLKNSSLVFVVMDSKHFHERLANNGKIMTFMGVPLFDALVRTFPST